jgi:hypothetical protein
MIREEEKTKMVVAPLRVTFFIKTVQNCGSFHALDIIYYNGLGHLAFSVKHSVAAFSILGKVARFFL